MLEGKEVPMRRILRSLFLLAAMAAPWARAAPLHFCYEDVAQPPWTLAGDGGLNITLLKQVAAATGEKFIMSRRPWTRCLEETRLGRMDGIVAAADTPERRQFVMPPLLPDGTADAAKAVHQTRVSIFLRSGSGAAWDGKTLHNPRGSVITQRGYFIGDLMRKRGQRVIDTIKSSEEALRLLVAGTADVAVLMEHSTQSMLRDDPRFRGQVALAPLPYTEMPLFLLINRERYARDPARIEAIWNAVAVVRASPAYRKLEDAEIRRNGGATLP
jgi:polar amino acid transport system substrate-binding protein